MQMKLKLQSSVPFESGVMHFATKWFTEAKGPDILVQTKKVAP